jgi:rhomboid protease GluP
METEEYKLTKTFLSKRPTYESFLAALLGLACLTLFFGADPKNFSANGYLVFEKKEYWRLITSSLLHSDLTHLAHNSFFMIGLSFLLHTYFGLWVFPFLIVIVGALINLITLSFYPPSVHLVGISGVIYFMASFWLTLFILIERRKKMKSRLIYASGISLIFFFPQVFSPQTSYLAHGIGFLLGIPIGVLYFLINLKKIRAGEKWVLIEKVPELLDDPPTPVS